MNKKMMLSFVLGGLIFSCITVYAAYKYQASEVGYTPSNSNFKVDNVEDAIEELYNNGYYKVGTAIYYNPVSNTKCSESQVTTNYTENGNNGIPTEIKTGCMKWYVIHDDGDKVSVILDHNTTAVKSWKTNGSNVIYAESDIKADIDALVTVSKWVVEPRLITVIEINTITDKTNFDSTNPYFYYYFNDSSNSQELKKISKGSSKYAWLYDYTSGCEEYGCNVEDSSNTGYWTNDPITSNSAKVWGVGSRGMLGDPYAANTYSSIGVRPVITISKSIIK